MPAIYQTCPDSLPRRINYCSIFPVGAPPARLLHSRKNWLLGLFGANPDNLRDSFATHGMMVKVVRVGFTMRIVGAGG